MTAAARLAGVVVLYHPEVDVVENIHSYLNELGLLVIIDNSPIASPNILDFVRSSDRIVYHGGGANRGIAAALNIGAREAMARGYEWLLTMDQDSRFEAGSLQTLIAVAMGEPLPGIVSPRHNIPGKRETDAAFGSRNVPYVMTSGNLLSLAAYDRAGPFLDKLFIDYVDYEYCLRLRREGFSIRVVSGSRLTHSLGKTDSRALFGFLFHPTHHDPVRRYYMTRNRLYVMKNYPAFAPSEMWAWFKELVKLFLFEKNKVQKLSYMANGARDFFKGRYGVFGK